MADALIHAFAWFQFGEESVAHLSIVEYRELISWIQWCETRIDILGEVHFNCWKEEMNE